MSAPCETCGNLNIKKPWWCLLKKLEKSSFDGCEGCSVLYRAVDIALKEWHESYTEDQFLKDTIEAHWQLSASRKLFGIDVCQIQSEGSSQLIMKLQLHTETGARDKFDDIASAGLVTPDSSSDECVLKIQDWNQACRSEHRKCNSIKTEWSQRVPIPAKRVIDVGDAETAPRLLEEKVVRGYYACLSHCWGATPPPMTTKETLQQRRASITMGELPQTFRDAIILTRALGLNYLWIDSLCIVQDDMKEWKAEAARMFEIYGNAYLTIAATAAADSTHGLFSVRETSLAIPGTNVFVRRKMDHSVFRMPILVAEGQQADKYPLFTRGWCLQERLLSNRILHFTHTEMVWQCRTHDTCECDGIQLLPSNNPSRLLTSRLKYNRVIEGSSGTDIWTIWREIIEDYCSTSLTKDSDYLPALSGVAAKFGLAGAGTYIAGLWHKPGALSLGSSPMFMDLLWKSASPATRRPDTRVAPSFSWASRIGTISFKNEAREGPVIKYQNDVRDGKRKYVHKCIFVVQLVHAYDKDGLDRYATAPNATIEVRTQLIPCGITIKHEGVYQVILEHGASETGGAKASVHDFTPDVASKIREEVDAECFVMPVAAYEHFKNEETLFDGLVIARIESKASRYRRVGLVEHLPAEYLRSDGHEKIVLE